MHDVPPVRWTGGTSLSGSEGYETPMALNAAAVVLYGALPVP